VTKNKNPEEKFDKYEVKLEGNYWFLIINGEKKFWTKKKFYPGTDYFKDQKELFHDGEIFNNQYRTLKRMAELGVIRIDITPINNIILQSTKNQKATLNEIIKRHDEQRQKQDKIKKLLKSPNTSPDSVFAEKVKDIEDQLQSLALWFIDMGIDISYKIIIPKNTKPRGPSEKTYKQRVKVYNAWIALRMKHSWPSKKIYEHISTMKSIGYSYTPSSIRDIIEKKYYLIKPVGKSPVK
jgi:hypothetical protein